MFADPVSNLMLIILLFFAGLLVMFIFILRSLEMSAQNQEEASRQISISLTDIERKVAELTFALRDKGLIDIADMPDCAKKKPHQPNERLEDLSSLFDKFSAATDETPPQNVNDERE